MVDSIVQRAQTHVATQLHQVLPGQLLRTGSINLHDYIKLLSV